MVTVGCIQKVPTGRKELKEDLVGFQKGVKENKAHKFRDLYRRQPLLTHKQQKVILKKFGHTKVN